ncbi:cytochrome P450 [Mycena vulgaris]|nr:cytochrome P450 [Mycena vulgaris]
MVTANMSNEIPDNQKLTDAEVVARESIGSAHHYYILRASSEVPVFFVAGHETTSTAAAWALHALSMNPLVQAKLREELLGIPDDNPTMDSLPYLEKVVRETMHVYSPVGFTIRVAMDDDVLPLSKKYVDRTGEVYDTIAVRQGTAIRIPIAEVHRDRPLDEAITGHQTSVVLSLSILKRNSSSRRGAQCTINASRSD